MTTPDAWSICPEHDAQSKSSICTDGRTDERHGEITHVTHKSSPTDTCAPVQDFIDFNGQIEIHREHQGANDEPRGLDHFTETVARWMTGFDPLPERWPLERTGERNPIPWPTRLAVGMRDGYICRHCHTPSYPRIEIDHIVPWSAGGSDRSSNLRVLCVGCNQRRSNRRDATEAWQPLPVTWWCLTCWHHDSPDRTIWRTGEDMNIRHRVSSGLVTAYCGTCKAARMTDVTL